MSNANLTHWAEQRSRITGESTDRARNEIKDLPRSSPLIPVASPGQAQFECDFLGTTGYGWSSHSDELQHPFGFTAITPRTESLLVDVPDHLLPDFVQRVLPATSNEHLEVQGMAGMRYEVRHHEVVLERVGAPGCLILQGMSPGVWKTAASNWERELRDTGATACWRLKSLHSDETHDLSEARQFWSTHGVVKRDWLLSGLLRRAGMFRSLSKVPLCVDLWVNYHRGGEIVVNIEWYNGADHKAVIDVLTGSKFGLSLTLDEPDDEPNFVDVPRYQVALTGNVDRKIKFYLRRAIRPRRDS